MVETGNMVYSSPSQLVKIVKIRYANSIEYGKACNAHRTVEDAQLLERGIFEVQATGRIAPDALYQ